MAVRQGIPQDIDRRQEAREVEEAETLLAVVFRRLSGWDNFEPAKKVPTENTGSDTLEPSNSNHT
jgi:hypothetical protein